jgi:hypothetical protein
MAVPKFQPAPPREQIFLDGDKPSKSWYQWFTLLPPRLTSPAVASTPASSAANGIPGQVSFDANFLYVCVATNSWRRIPLNPF